MIASKRAGKQRLPRAVRNECRRRAGLQRRLDRCTQKFEDRSVLLPAGLDDCPDAFAPMTSVLASRSLRSPSMNGYKSNPYHPDGVWLAAVDPDQRCDPLSAPLPTDLLRKLPGRRGRGIRTAGSESHLDELFAELSRGGTSIKSPHLGPSVTLPDGTVVRTRPGSLSGGPTIDITFPGGKIVKVHISPWPSATN
jgi:hypothetical protein